VDDSLTNFVNRWNNEAKDCPLAILDFTWPSISLCELIILPLIGKRELSKIESEIVGGVIGYCGEFVKRIWQDSGITLTVEKSSGEQFVIIGWDNGLANKIDLGKVLRSVIAERPFPLRIFNNYARNISTPHGLIAPVVLGVILGLHPSFEGPWQEEAENEAESRVNKLTQSLAKSVATHFQRVFPADTISQVGEIYLEGAIYPPIGMRERYPLAERAKSFVLALKKLDLSENQILGLAGKLVCVADYQLSALGLVIIGALGTKHSPELLARSERFGRSAGFLRPAVVELRKEFKITDEWTNSVSEVELAKHFEYESRLGLLPFIYAPAFDSKLLLAYGKIKELYRALAQNDVASSLALSSEISIENPQLINIRLQRIYLEVLTGAIEDADLALRGLLTEPGVEDDWRVYSLLAVTVSSLGNLDREKVDSVIRYFQSAYQYCPSNSEWFDLVCNDAARSLVGGSEMEMASNILEQGLAVSKNPLPLLFTKMILLRAKKSEAALAVVLNKICELSPLDPRVFTARYLYS